MSAKNDTTTIVEEFALKTKQEQKKEQLTRWMPLMILCALCVFFSAACPESFLTLYNVKTILNQLAITLIIALGLTFVTLTGAVDLSVDGVVSLGGCLLSVLVLNSKYATDLGLLGVALSLGVGALFGALSGLLHVKLKVSSFMVTYAMGLSLIHI